MPRWQRPAWVLPVKVRPRERYLALGQALWLKASLATHPSRADQRVTPVLLAPLEQRPALGRTLRVKASRGICPELPEVAKTAPLRPVGRGRMLPGTPRPPGGMRVRPPGHWQPIWLNQALMAPPSSAQIQVLPPRPLPEQKMLNSAPPVLPRVCGPQ